MYNGHVSTNACDIQISALQECSFDSDRIETTIWNKISHEHVDDTVQLSTVGYTTHFTIRDINSIKLYSKLTSVNL